MSDQITSDGDITDRRPFQLQTSASQSLSRQLENENWQPRSTSSRYDYENGLCLMFNHYIYDKGRHDVRNGTNVDRDALRLFFERIGFRVLVYEDRTVEEIFDTLNSFANNDDNFDCLVCIFLTHGKENSLAAYDVDYNMQLIFTPFLSQNCPKLRGKAKLFIINACQGNALGKVNVLPREEHDACNVPIVPLNDHFVLAMSTVPGCKSWRHRTEGTFYIQSLVNILNRCATTEDIHTILTAVNREMVFELRYGLIETEYKHQIKQMPIFLTSLIDKFYFKITHQQR